MVLVVGRSGRTFSLKVTVFAEADGASTKVQVIFLFCRSITGTAPVSVLFAEERT